ncbi:SHOCT domain-containing protein [Corynebacterium amycolatum]|uniref:SHOCT domain-containing protein n=1 Tax=Corynebacterium amycolatum TaxID=43765 RepID=UPI001CCEC046|nr:PH domain-containing protein [Corynebacterium amycolatum]MCA0444413.1 PH domain-containing protein [Corynebacterium amycolatum]
MTTKTRLISASPHDVLLIAEQAIAGLRTKKVDRSDNSVTAHVKRGFGRTSPLTVTIDDKALSVAYDDQSLAGDAYTILNAVEPMIDMQGAPEWLQSSPLLNHVLDKLETSERILHAAEGYSDGKLAALLVTNQRVRLLTMQTTHSSERVIGIMGITSVSLNSGPVFDELKLTVSNEEITLDTIKHGTADDAVAAILRLVNKGVENHDPLQTGGGGAQEKQATNGGLADLEKLAELHAQGILTDEEFAAAKKKALGI